MKRQRRLRRPWQQPTFKRLEIWRALGKGRRATLTAVRARIATADKYGVCEIEIPCKGRWGQPCGLYRGTPADIWTVLVGPKGSKRLALPVYQGGDAAQVVADVLYGHPPHTHEDGESVEWRKKMSGQWVSGRAGA